jgi:hypothetical protein
MQVEDVQAATYEMFEAPRMQVRLTPLVFVEQFSTTYAPAFRCTVQHRATQLLTDKCLLTAML